MTQEKQLLLIDLCARLPYNLLGKDAFDKIRELKVIYPTGTIIAFVSNEFGLATRDDDLIITCNGYQIKLSDLKTLPKEE